MTFSGDNGALPAEESTARVWPLLSRAVIRAIDAEWLDVVGAAGRLRALLSIVKLACGQIKGTGRQ